MGNKQYFLTQVERMFIGYLVQTKLNFEMADAGTYPMSLSK